MHRTASNLFPQALNCTQAEFSQTGGSCQPFCLPPVHHPHQGQSTGLHVLLNPHPSAPFGGTGKSSFPLRASSGNNWATGTTVLPSSWLEGMHRAEPIQQASTARTSSTRRAGRVLEKVTTRNPVLPAQQGKSGQCDRGGRHRGPC